MRQTLLLFVAIFASVFAYSQVHTTNNVSIVFGQDHNVNTMNEKVNNDKRFFRDPSVLGSPYESDEYTETGFFTKDKGYVTQNARLNLFDNTFEVVVKDQLINVNKTYLDSVVYKGNIYLFKEAEVQGKKSIYPMLKVSNAGNCSLFLLKYKIFKEEVKTQGYNEAKPPRIEDQPDLYVLEIGDKAIPLNTINSLLKEFPEQKDELKNFIKKNKVKLKDQESLKKLVAYLDSSI